MSLSFEFIDLFSVAKACNKLTLLQELMAIKPTFCVVEREKEFSNLKATKGWASVKNELLYVGFLDYLIQVHVVICRQKNEDIDFWTFTRNSRFWSIFIEFFRLKKLNYLLSLV